MLRLDYEGYRRFMREYRKRMYGDHIDDDVVKPNAVVREIVQREPSCESPALEGDGDVVDAEFWVVDDQPRLPSTGPLRCAVARTWEPTKKKSNNNERYA